MKRDRAPETKTVVDDRSVLPQNGRVLRLSGLQCMHIVGGDVIHELDRLRSAHDELAHVAHIEQPRLLAHRLVLGRYSGRVLHRHLEPGERDELGAERRVHVVEGGPLERPGGGGRLCRCPRCGGTGLSSALGVGGGGCLRHRIGACGGGLAPICAKRPPISRGVVTIWQKALPNPSFRLRRSL